MSWDDNDFWSADPFVRFNAHQAAKGRPGLPDVDAVRKAQKEGRFECVPDESAGVEEDTAA